MADNKELEIELLLKQLREKKERASKLSEEISAEEREHREQAEIERKQLEELTTPISVPYTPDDETSSIDIDEGPFALRTEEKNDTGKPNRSLKDLLSDVGDVEKRSGMLAPSIERGIDEPVDVPIIEVATERTTTRIDPASHPLFTTPNTTAQLPKFPLKANPIAEGEASPVPQVQDMGLRLDPEAVRRQQEGVINVKEKVDDEFREFFGDTVIIDRESIDSRQTKQRKITDFVISTEDGQTGGPVFEDLPETDDLNEYRTEEDTEPILAELNRRHAIAVFKMVVSGLCAAVLVALNLCAFFGTGALSTVTSNEFLFACVNAACALVAFAVCARGIGKGLLGLVSFKGNDDSLYALAALFGVAEPVALYLLSAPPVAYVAAPLGALAIFFACLGQSVFMNDVMFSFKAVSTGFDKHAAYIPEDESFLRRVTKGLEIENPQVLLKRKTGFTDNFMRYAFSEDRSAGIFRVFAPIMLLVTLVCGALMYLRTRDIPSAVKIACAVACLASTLASTIKSISPLHKMQKDVARFGTVVPGFDSAVEISNANTVLVDAQEIFPKGSVVLHGIKNFNRERVDRSILYAASVLIPYCETLAPVFKNMIMGKTEMLYTVDSIECEDGRGFAGWIDKNRVLLGTREMMEAHEIALPSLDYEIRYTKTRARDAVYLAVGGVIFSMFVVSYSLTTEVEEILHGLEHEGISVLVRTTDPNVTTKKISDIFAVPQSMFAVMRSTETQLAAPYTSYSSHSSALFTHIGSLTSFTRGIFASRKLGSVLKLTNLMTLISMALGAAFGLVTAAVGTPLELSVLSALLFEGAWLLIIWLIAKLGSY